MPETAFQAADAMPARAHAPQPVPETVPPPGPPEMPELPDEVPGDAPPDVIDPPAPEELPPVTEPGRAPPVRMCGVRRPSARPWVRSAVRSRAGA